MRILELTLRWIILLSVLYGFYHTATKKIGMRHEFAPIFVCSSIAVFTFIAGIFGGLLLSVYVIVVAGLLCFLQMTISHFRNTKPVKRRDFFHLLFLLGSACFLVLLLDTKLMHYDNFTHWALVVKEMLITQAFPHADSVMIQFKNYPLGMSSFLYFVCEVLGYQESNMIFAQGIVIISCFYALFGIIGEKKRFFLYAYVCAGCSILSVFTTASRINNLLVDVVVPLVALATIATFYWYRNDFNKACIVGWPLLAFLVVVKNTGIVFAIFAILYFLYNSIVYRKTSTKKVLRESEHYTISCVDGAGVLLLKTMGFLSLSLSTYMLWQYHVSTVFAEVENKFDMPAALANGVPSGKTPTDIQTIIDLFLDSIVDISTRPTIGIILFELVAIVGCIINAFVIRKKWALPKVFLCLNLALILYYLGILSLYIFSMPLDEALYLAGFERYACSIVVFFGGALLICLTLDMERSFHYAIGEVADYRSFLSIETKTIYNNSVIVCLGLAILFLTSEYNGLHLQNANYDTTLPAQVKSVIGDSWQEDVDDAKYLFYASDTDAQITSYYLQHIAKYYLRSENVDAICYFYEDNLENLLSQYDVLVVIESDSAAQTLLQKHFGISGEAGVYHLDDLK